MKFIFVRHGQTYFNQIGLTQGWCDSPLSTKGEKQVNCLEKFLGNVQIDYIYSSPLGRAYQSAALLNQNRHLKICVDERLKEIHFGYFEGLPEHLTEHFQVESPNWFQDLKMNYELYHSEDIKHVIERHNDFMKEVLKKHHEDDTILIVGHGCSFYGFLYGLLKKENNESHIDFPFLPNACAVTLQFENNHFQFLGFKDINEEMNDNEYEN